MIINISPDFLGSPHWVQLNTEDQKLVSKKQLDQNSLKNSWTLSNWSTGDEHDFNTYAKVRGIELQFPQNKYRKAIEQLNIKEEFGSLPWWMILPKQQYRDALQELTRDVVGLCDQVDIDYYINVFEPTRAVLDDLERCHIDIEKYEKYVSMLENDNRISILQTFHHNDGICDKIYYDTVGSRTGRLTVRSGPNILTLKKDYRDIITSRWKEGKIMMLDFSSLEARIIAYNANINLPDDVYSYISSQILGGVSRDIAKISVISTLYGGGISRLTQYVDHDTAQQMVENVKSLFKIDVLSSQLHEEFRTHGFIRNRYGRRIQTPSADHVLINSYAQSTGVDVALLGFKNVIEKLKNYNSVPLFVLVDALIIDMHPDEIKMIDELCDICSQIMGYEHKFFVKSSEV